MQSDDAAVRGGDCLVIDREAPEDDSMVDLGCLKGGGEAVRVLDIVGIGYDLTLRILITIHQSQDQSQGKDSGRHTVAGVNHMSSRSNNICGLVDDTNAFLGLWRLSSPSTS